MQPLRQYFDLFETHAPGIDAGSCAELNAFRGRAYEMLKAVGLPRRGSENYEQTDLPLLLSPDYGLNISRLPLQVNSDATFSCDVPVNPATALRVLNDIVDIPEESPLPEGVEAISFCRLSQTNPELLTQLYGRLADMANPLVALNSMLVQDGVLIRIKKGAKVERPIQLVNILAAGIPMMAVRRVIIWAEEDSEAKILVCDHSQSSEIKALTLECVEIYAERNSRLDYYSLEESTKSTSRLSTLWSSQKSGSALNICGMTLFNGITRNEYYCRFDAADASLSLNGMGIEDSDRKLSTFTRIDHDYPRCHSNELFKYSLADKAIGSFAGRIYVAPGATGTEAYQANRNLTSGTEAKMHSKPQLEIYNDDVKCSHGCATGQLDPLQLFYMRTRGIDEAEAKLLLRQAFMADVVEKVNVPGLRDRLKLLIERRFAGQATACSGCAAQKCE